MNNKLSNLVLWAMNAEQALAYKISNPDFLCVTGSRLYGTARYDENGQCISDIDKRGVIIPPWEYISTRVWEQDPIQNEQDGVVYSLGFFIRQLIASNPQHLELLFVPKDNILISSSISDELFKNRHLFVSQRYYKRLLGFSNSEWRKARMVELEKSERTKTEDEIINDIKNVFGPKFGDLQKEKMDEVLSILFSCHPRKEISSNNKVSGKRKEEYNKYGYGTSSATHSIRLIRQCTELLKTGNITFPRPDAAELRKIKFGELSIAEVEKIYNEAIVEVNDAIKNTSLPQLPDTDNIVALYEKMIAKFLSEESWYGNPKSRLSDYQGDFMNYQKRRIHAIEASESLKEQFAEIDALAKGQWNTIK